MGAPAPAPNQSSRGSLSLWRTVVILTCVTAGVWFGFRNGQRPAASVSQEVKREPERQLAAATPEPQAAAVEPAAGSQETKPAESATALPPAPSPAQIQARVDAAVAMAQNSPADALRWAKSLPAAERPAAVIAAANESARTKPADALAALVELEPSPERDAGLTHAASQWAALDSKAATAWAAEGAPGELRERICSAVAIALADRDPQGAADFVAMQMADGVSLRTAAVSVVQRWAQKDDRAARQWAEQFPPGPLRDDALREIETQARASAGAK